MDAILTTVARATGAAIAALPATEAAQQLVDRFEQSALTKAFRGALVPQDPNDEPASELLERIRAERTAAEPIKRGRGSATRIPKPPPVSLARTPGSSSPSNGKTPAASARFGVDAMELIVASLVGRGLTTHAEVVASTGLDANTVRPVLKSLERLGKIEVQ